MLTSTFCHIPGIGPQTEMRLWAAGISSWEDLMAAEDPPLPRPRRAMARLEVQESLARHHGRDASYFAACLPPGQHWRMLPEYRDQTAYLDIETEGLSRERCGITTIAVYDGRVIKTYVRDRNLDEFPEDIKKYGLLVTFNGSLFDLPMLSSTFGISFDQAHVDLRFVLRETGLSGGLKKCEHALGIDRGDLTGLNGYAAVLLWQSYVRKGRDGALRTLLAYNVADVLGLEVLAVFAYNRMLEQLECAPASPLPMPPLAKNPYAPDPKILKRLPKRLFS